MKKSEMRKAFDKAIRKLNEADCAVQEFASYLVFKGYPLDREPQVSAVDETCIIIQMAHAMTLYASSPRRLQYLP